MKQGTAKEKWTLAELRRQIAIYRRGLKLISQFTPRFTLHAFLFAAETALQGLLGLYLSAGIIDEITGARSMRKLVFLAVLLVGSELALLTLSKFSWTKVRVSHIAAVAWEEHSLNVKSFSLDYSSMEDPAVRALRQEIIDNRQAGGLRSLMMQFTFSISSVITLVVSFAMSVSLFTKHSPKPLTGLLAFADSRLSSLLMLLLTALLAALLIRFTMENRKQQFSRRRELSLSQKLFRYFLDDYLDDSKAGKDVRIFHQRGLIRHASDQAFLQYKEQQKTLQQEDFRMMRRVDAVETGLSGFVYALVALKALAGAFGVGSLVKYVGLISELIYAILHLSYNVEGVRSNNRYLERLFLYLDQESSLHSGTREPEQGASHTMEFRNVSFRYPGSEDYALRELNITLHAGERLAVVGRNGSGKTTMIKLLCRLYDPDEGSILLDGIDIRDYSYEAYQALFSVVFQDFKLFSFSLGQNVAAQRDYDTAKAERCLTLAGLGERLKNLPQGLETPIYKDFEENGVEISGGEAQKIAIARALYKDAPFMILDEPTAALDPLAEYEIYSKFNEIVGEKSAVFISHRLSSCRFCHKIAVFREGRLVQHGTHENLLAEQGSHYAELWNAQAQYYTNIQRKRS